MAKATGKQYGVGLRRAVIFPLNADGLPLVTGTQAMEGFEVLSPKAYTLTLADVRKITHPGSDRVVAIDFLPATEAPTAEVRVSTDDNPLAAYLTNVKEFQVGEASMVAYQTDQQGAEPDVGLLLYQQSLDVALKRRHYRFHLIPSARAVVMPSGMDENPAETRYSVAPNPTVQHLWGTPLEHAVEGATETAIINGMAKGRPAIVAFGGDGATSTFVLPIDKPCLADAKMEVWVDGVLQVQGVDYTPSADDIVFGSPPADEAVVVAFYEH